MFKDFRSKMNNILLSRYEESTFYIYRTDANAVLARGINGFEAAKAKANKIRKTQNLKWDQVKFKSERGLQGAGSGSSTSADKRSQFGVRNSSKTFSNLISALNPALGEAYRRERWHSGTTGKGHNCSAPRGIRRIGLGTSV